MLQTQWVQGDPIPDLAELCGFGVRVRSPDLYLSGFRQLGTGFLDAVQSYLLSSVRFCGTGHVPWAVCSLHHPLGALHFFLALDLRNGAL